MIVGIRLQYERTFDAKEVVELIARGERLAEDCFVQRYRLPVLHLLQRMTGDHALAEDLTHDAMIGVLRKLREGSVKDPAKLSSYTYATARNLYLAWTRKVGRHEETGGSLDHLVSPAVTPECEYLLALDKDALRRSIASMTIARDREILFRHYINDQSKVEVCEALRLTSQHFDRVICRARMRLQAWMLQVAPLHPA